MSRRVSWCVPCPASAAWSSPRYVPGTEKALIAMNRHQARFTGSGRGSLGVPVTDSVNEFIAERLREMSDLLQQQQANPFRVRAYRQAADTLAGGGEDLRERFEREGMDGLETLPGVGPK